MALQCSSAARAAGADRAVRLVSSRSSRLGLLLTLLLLGMAQACASSEDQEPSGCVSNSDCASGLCIAGKCKDDGSTTDGSDGDTGSLFDTQKTDTVGELSADSDPDTSPDTIPDTTSDVPGPPLDGTSPEASTDTGADLVAPSDADPSKAPSIFIDPDSYTFSYIAGQGAPVGKDMVITNMGQGNLIVDAIEWVSGATGSYTLHQMPNLPVTLGPYEQTGFQVAFHEVGGAGPATLRVHSNDPLQPWAEVGFDAVSKIDSPDPTPCIQVFPTKLSFGQVVRGTTKEMTFNIKSCDVSTPLVVPNISRGQGGFLQPTLSEEFQLVNPPSWPLTIAPGQLVPITVSYSPGLAGIDSGHWKVKSTDPDQPEVKVNVDGVGVPPPLEDIALHIVVDWDTNGTDVDTHLVMPGGTYFTCPDDCYYGNPSPDWGVQGDFLDDPFLDYDDTDGYGPENVNLQEPAPGVYRVWIHYFSDDGLGVSSSSSSSNVTVRIFINAVLAAEFGPVQLDDTNHSWDVCDVDWPSGTITPLGNTFDWSGSTGSCAFPF